MGGGGQPAQKKQAAQMRGEAGSLDPAQMRGLQESFGGAPKNLVPQDFGTFGWSRHDLLLLGVLAHFEQEPLVHPVLEDLTGQR